jgi:hypothetical protein
MSFRLELKIISEEQSEAEANYDTLEEALEVVNWVLPYTSAIVLMSWEYKGQYKWEMEGNGTELKIYEVA